MATHHQPYTLSDMQRRLYVILVSEARAASVAGEETARLSVADLAERTRSDTSNTRLAVERLQYKLPIIPGRVFMVHCRRERTAGGGQGYVYWAAPKPRRRSDLPERHENAIEWPDDPETPL